jgi:hypothetical protein
MLRVSTVTVKRQQNGWPAARLTRLGCAKGVLQVSSSKNSTPTAQKSMALLYPLESTISGAIYSAAPQSFKKSAGNKVRKGLGHGCGARL